MVLGLGQQAHRSKYCVGIAKIRYSRTFRADEDTQSVK